MNWYKIAKSQSHDNCPICGERYESQCKCSGPHTVEDLKKGHGRHCSNGHSWSGDVVYDMATDTDLFNLSDKWVDYLSGQPETGMGFQKVTIIFEDGVKMDTSVYNGQYVKNMPKESRGKVIKEIQVK